MIKLFQRIAYFGWRHLLTMMIFFIMVHVFYIDGKVSLLNSSLLLITFSAVDFFKTKRIKIDNIQKDHLKKFAFFIWRHLLKLGVGVLITYVLIEGHISWTNTFYLFIGAILIDWIKVQKGSRRPNHSYDQMMDYSRRQNDASNIGSSAWMTNPGMAGSPANHLYNLGSTTYRN